MRVPRAIACALGLALAGSAAAAPFTVQDQNPLLAGFGLPRAMPARIAAGDDWNFAANFDWGNSAIAQFSNRESLIVDAETRELRLMLGHRIAERWAVRVQVPYRDTGGGALDSFIDDWHEWFGFSDGPRDNLPRDAYRITYARNGVTLLNLRSPASGLGDISAHLGYSLADRGNSAMSAWLGIKLPTGDAGKLTGSGGTDASLVIAGERRFAGRWSSFGQLGASYLGDGDLLPAQQRNFAWSAMAGLGLDVLPSLDLKVQLDAHSAVFDGTRLEFLGEAFILTVGGSYRFAGWQLDLGVSEDVKVDASPDVVFVFGLRRGVGTN